MALALDVVIFGNGRQHGGAFTQLLSAPQDNFSALVVFFDPSLDGNHSSLELPDVADFVEIAPEHNHYEWTGAVIEAEVEEGDAIVALFDAQHGSADAVRLPNMLAGFGNREAVLWRIILRRTALRGVTGPGVFR